MFTSPAIQITIKKGIPAQLSTAIRAKGVNQRSANQNISDCWVMGRARTVINPLGCKSNLQTSETTTAESKVGVKYIVLKISLPRNWRTNSKARPSEINHFGSVV